MLCLDNSPRIRLLLATILPAIALFQTSAGEADSLKIQAQPFELSVRRGEFVGHEQVVRQFITLGTNQFMFVMPPKVKSDSATPGSLVWSGPEGGYRIEFHIFAPVPQGDASRWEQELKRNTLENHPRARDIDELNTTVAGRSAQGLLFRESLPGFGDRLFRLFWVPCAAGILEFTLNASADQSTVGVQTLDSLLISMRSNEQGNLEIIRRSDKS
jgi:hypothetical protein